MPDVNLGFKKNLRQALGREIGSTSRKNPFAPKDDAGENPYVSEGVTADNPLTASSGSLVSTSTEEEESFWFNPRNELQQLDEPNRLIPDEDGPTLVCFCVIDENDDQLEGDVPSDFVRTYQNLFGEGLEFYHIVFNFLPQGGDTLNILEFPDDEITFLYKQPRVDGYDWLSIVEFLTGTTLDPDSTIIFYCIDESGSMEKSDVKESLDKFDSKTDDYEIPPVEITMDPAENMYLPFLREDVLEQVTKKLEELGYTI